jgi:outer membrane protein TolC
MIALQNHPQVQAAQHEMNYSNRQIVESRAAYYPNVTGELTGSQANNLARIGAGDITASRLFSRFGQGVVVHQLVTDSGRTSQSVWQLAFAGPSHGASRTSHALRRAPPGNPFLFLRFFMRKPW